LQYTWYADHAATSIATGAVTMAVLPIGPHSIVLAVSDGMAAATDTVSVAVLTISQALDLLTSSVSNGVTHAQPLIATLTAALNSIDRSNPTAAINELQAFQNKVTAQLMPIDPVLAQSLIQAAQSIIQAIMGGVVTSSSPPVIKAVERLTNRSTHIRFVAPAGRIYVVEASSDMATWQSIGVPSDNGDGTFDFNDASNADAAVRFYRIVAP
jgi:hypothetical protein